MCYRPRLEPLESRVVLSARPTVAPALGAALVAPALKQHSQILPLNIVGVTIENGGLVANGVVGATAFSTPITATATTGPQPNCLILNLMIGPIHLDLLGLVVDTSPICLSITAMSGNGNLLGNLLCDIANLLNQGVPLNQVLSGLTTQQQVLLTRGLGSMFNTTALDLTAFSSVSNMTMCNILDLSMGPVELTLLGLNVHLDNCDNGPITLTITAQSGPGNLLGNLICDLAHLLDHHAGQQVIMTVENLIAGVIGVLVG
jgi:hypothetical protein